MKNVYRIEFHSGSKEELFPDFTPDFPYTASCSQLDQFMGRFVPWHWHKTVELFYMESGRMEYCTPKGTMIFPAGSGGMVNSNVLHMTRPQAESEKNIQLLHIFDPSFIAGHHGSRIEQKYVTPITAAPQVEIIPLSPEDPVQANILDDIRESFHLSENDFGYEVKLRETLSDIWIRLLAISRPLLEEKGDHSKANDKIKTMMVYVHEHFGEKISISEIAAAAFSSERECFRAFHDCLHMTPVEYINNYRLQMACHLLANGREPITSISHACGLGSSSYFGKVFREYMGCTPLEYRRKWQDSDI
ncbi:AraC family transcriptional regulator [Lacrimispora saccharolytica]|uniref:Transcriptional regulator, AraC family n=1 Tax=Lacrimispora saccharolytica (strain ATCC 35040 / DSM 2544 / NRCC 2533 / WM1) TaxID=610130 RepID=D9R427_LACSW|nr:AraC family transcriptional regulator [Lacrimispora saccharolytica]ADL03140.1 transcriptional regulator, AraC family [[Clostridium] saccharolyticum WM1]QRV18686.1 helix-turn-helix domain-containing protein [Lacrimispora saccharolytica]